MYQFDSDQGGPLERTAVDEYDSDDDRTQSHHTCVRYSLYRLVIVANDSLGRGGVTHDDNSTECKRREAAGLLLIIDRYP